MQLASRFASRSPVLRSEYPLSDDQIRSVVPSIFAEAPHGSRSQRYSYIPTVTVLDELRGEGFQPFMATCYTYPHGRSRSTSPTVLRAISACRSKCCISESTPANAFYRQTGKPCNARQCY